MALKYMLDTNICIYLAKQAEPAVTERFSQLGVGEVAMSIITYGELVFGARKSAHPIKTKAVLNRIVSLIPVLPMPLDAGDHYGRVRCQLEQSGRPIGNNDLWIGAHCMAMGATLVTNNEREFSRITSLKLENWTKNSR